VDFFEVRSFFSVNDTEIFAKLCLQGSFKRVFDRSFTAVHTAMPIVYARRSVCAGQSRKRFPLGSMGFNSPLYAGSNPAVCKQAYRQWFGRCRKRQQKLCTTVHESHEKAAMTPRRKPRFSTQCNTRFARKQIPCYFALCQKCAFRIEAKNTYVFGRLCCMSHCQR